MKDEGRKMKDEGRKIKEERRETRDEGRGTRDEGRGKREEVSSFRRWGLLFKPVSFHKEEQTGAEEEKSGWYGNERHFEGEVSQIVYGVDIINPEEKRASWGEIDVIIFAEV